MKQNTILEQKKLYGDGKANRSSCTSSKRHVVLMESLSKIGNESDCNESWDDTTLITIETLDSTHQESSASSCSCSTRDSADAEIKLQAHPSTSKNLPSSQRTATKSESKPRAIRELGDFNSHGRKSELQSSRRKRLDMSRPIPRNYSRLLMDANYDVHRLHRLHKKGRWIWEPSEPSKTSNAMDHDPCPNPDTSCTTKRSRPMRRVSTELTKATNANNDFRRLDQSTKSQRGTRILWSWEPSKTASAIDQLPDSATAKGLEPRRRVSMGSTNSANHCEIAREPGLSSLPVTPIGPDPDGITAEGSRLQRQGSMEFTNANNATNNYKIAKEWDVSSILMTPTDPDPASFTAKGSQPCLGSTEAKNTSNNCEIANRSGFSSIPMIPIEDDMIDDEHQVEISTLVDLGRIPDLGEDLGPCDRNMFSAPVPPVMVNTVEVNSKCSTITTKRTWENTSIDIRMESETRMFGIPVLKKQKCDTNHGATAVYPTKQHPSLTAGERALKTLRQNPRRCPDASDCGNISGRSTPPEAQHLSIFSSPSPISTKRSKRIMKPFYVGQNSQSIIPSTGITDASPTAIVTPTANRKKCIELSIFLETSDGRGICKQKVTGEDWGKLDSMDCLRNQTFDLEWEKDFGESLVKMDPSSHSLDSALLAPPCAREFNTSETEQPIMKLETIKEMIVKHEMNLKIRKEILQHYIPETVLSQVRTICSSVP